MIPLSTFPEPLRRLILCGDPDKGLPPAWGPLVQEAKWHASGVLIQPLYHDDMDMPRVRDIGTGNEERLDVGRWHQAWFLPMDGASPWPARLALVCGLLATPQAFGDAGAPIGARVRVSKRDGRPSMRLDLCWCPPGSHDTEWYLDAGSGPLVAGANLRYGGHILTTLPTHHAAHPDHPAVGLLLALWDAKGDRP